jgi:hypothetical protein
MLEKRKNAGLEALAGERKNAGLEALAGEG